MHCPFCRDSETRVVDSRDTESGAAIRRRRECTSCGQRFTTFERMETSPLVVTKRDGSREPFDRAKVVSGIAKACTNRPVDDDAMLRICDEIEESARTPERSGGASGSEIRSEDIGHEVLVRLKALDEVAYVRFASVYREFSDVAEFERVIAELDVTAERSGAVIGSKPVGGRG